MAFESKILKDYGYIEFSETSRINVYIVVYGTNAPVIELMGEFRRKGSEPNAWQKSKRAAITPKVSDFLFKNNVFEELKTITNQ